MTLPVDPSRYAAFLAVMAVLAATPGPANLFAVATGLQRGRSAVFSAVAGMNAASLVWFGAAALGLGALILAFPTVFHVLAYVGAAYLVWLGARAILSGLRDKSGPSHVPMAAGRSAFRDGFAVQIANPKIMVFLGAVLPPFLDVHRALAPQLALFALGTVGADLVTMTAYGLGGAALSHRMEEAHFRRGFALFSGVLLITAACLIVIRA